ncbi:MAG: helix-turn-helix domain-containing protein [Syntrophales bacterium]|nr:helix-turn-helix domain-containing protein [Syntrophales bacterium]
MDRLIAHNWPGNVRELQNVIERALIQHRDGYLEFHDLSALSHQPVSVELQQRTAAENILTLDELNRKYIQRVLTLTGGKINGKGGAAELLKINPYTLRTRMKKLEIAYGRKRVNTSHIA